MSTLFVVRHGQASFFADDYDQLSEIGCEQARRLGTYWAERSESFDVVVSGPRRRQIDTARLVGEALQQQGGPWPETTVCDEFDEYHAELVLKQALPRLVEEHASLRQLYEELSAATERAEQLRRFQRVYEVVIGQWAGGTLDLPEIESWPTFVERVQRGLGRIVAEYGGRRRVVLFTSGGPVGVALQRALNTSIEKTLQVAWMVRNGSFSEFLFSGERFTLSSFNRFPHLDAPELLTYR